MSKEILVQKIRKWLEEEIIDLDEAFEDEEEPSEIWYQKLIAIDSIAAKFFRNLLTIMPENFEKDVWLFNSDDISPSEIHGLDFALLTKAELQQAITLQKEIQAKFQARAIKENRL